MLQCPKCLRQFDAGVAVCPDDGTPLGAETTVADAPAPAVAAAPADPLVGLVLDV